MDKETDIAIIGGGLAAFAAAVELEKAGLEITLVRKAPGAAALSSGAWDLADSPVGCAGREPDAFPSVGENFLEILRRKPQHPFRHFSSDPSLRNLLLRLQSWALRAGREIPLEMQGDADNPLALLTDLGTIKPTAMVQKSMVEGDLRRMKRAKILVVGIRGFPAFNASFLAKALQEFAERQSNPYLEGVESIVLSLPQAVNSHSLSSVEVAQAFENEEVVGRFTENLLTSLKSRSLTHLLLPPVMGFSRTSAILDYLRQKTGLAVAETLATPMSVPGWRLSEAILQYFRKMEYQVIPGEVVGFDSERKVVKALRVHLGEDRIRLRAKTIILATGKYLGGGLEFRDKFREPIFGLPLFCEGEALKGGNPFRFSRPRSYESQPFFSIGVGINPNTQPIDEDRQVLFENLFAAGRVLTGFDPVHEGGAAGVSLLTGTLAAQAAMA